MEPANKRARGRKRCLPSSPQTSDEASRTAFIRNNEDPKKKQAFTVVMEENGRLKERHAREVEGERLRAQVDALSKSNLEKVEEAASLQQKVSGLQFKLARRKEEIAVLKERTTLLSSNLEGAQQQLHDIHKSWQGQLSELSAKESNLDSLRHQLKQVQEQFQRDTQNLISERKERKRLADCLEGFRKTYESQGKLAEWNNIMSGANPVAAVKQQCEC